MSYCRWSENNSVYLYDNANDKIECCGCTELNDLSEVMLHLYDHERQHGRVTPELKTYFARMYLGSVIKQDLLMDRFMCGGKVYPI